jgi:hypothetical protein
LNGFVACSDYTSKAAQSVCPNRSVSGIPKTVMITMVSQSCRRHRADVTPIPRQCVSNCRLQPRMNDLCPTFAAPFSSQLLFLPMDASDSPSDQIDAPSNTISFNKSCRGTTGYTHCHFLRFVCCHNKNISIHLFQRVFPAISLIYGNSVPDSSLPHFQYGSPAALRQQ